ncbi:cytochrome c5 family protein, partial [Vibrio sp. 1974]|nr:cytochrome c5 family protein [Vibrio sp. 1974]
APRIEQGKDVLVKHALEGFNAMPAKGTCMDCSDDEIIAAIDHMIDGL